MSRAAHCLSWPRPGPPRDDELLPDQSQKLIGHALLEFNYGAAPLESVPSSPQHTRQPYFGEHVGGSYKRTGQAGSLYVKQIKANYEEEAEAALKIV